MAGSSLGSIWRHAKAGDFDLMSDREVYIALGLAGIALVALLAIALQIVEPPPPKRIKITTGSETGAYFAYGKAYAEQLKRHGITLEVLPSRGSLENLERLRDPSSGIVAGFVQSGASGEKRPAEEDADPPNKLQSLSSVAFEPVWVFHREPRPVTTLAALKGKRIAIGVDGSGVRLVAQALLPANGITAADAILEPLAPDDAVKALEAGTLDAAIVVASAEAPIVQKAIADGFGIVDFEHADAYVRRFPWLSKQTLPRGSINLGRDLPRADITLLAATANLVVRDDLHPAVAFLLMDIAANVHTKPSMFNAPRDFPSERWLEFEQSDESKRYFKSGKPFLQRYLPFWIANLIERLSVTVLPVLLVLLPLLKGVPGFFDWREKAQFARLYDDIKRYEQGTMRNDPPSAVDGQLEQFETRLNGFKLAASRLVDYYNVKAHLDVLKARYGSLAAGTGVGS